ncbi:hypothetical protein [Bacillus cereus group sp. BfR-BA-01383]|uniref:hypothetical protein n=1 Tax=Bacillus cereus group sp. BfR-BA-01383 TaxID=2920327 RepID=UPI001F59CF3D|nr:hypothetical protein [Bacillus cereus group sp. BfR-BA-01383]
MDYWCIFGITCAFIALIIGGMVAAFEDNTIRCSGWGANYHPDAISPKGLCVWCDIFSFPYEEGYGDDY